MTGAGADERNAVVIVGGGAAGLFAAIRAAELAPHRRVTVLEKGSDLLQKVAISGGGRCNLTHDCRDAQELARHYPRGGRALRGMFSRFAVGDTVDWFAARGVRLKTEADGRMFPETDDSATITGCLIEAARSAGVEILTRRSVRAACQADGGFEIECSDAQTLRAGSLLIATGGMRGAGRGRKLAASFGHTIVEPVPSLFTLHIDDPRLRGLAGVAAPDVEVRIAGEHDLCARGPLLVTHKGLSGPCVLMLSAWGARRLAACDYVFELGVNWLPALSDEAVGALLAAQRSEHPRRLIRSSPAGSLPRRLWERLVAAAGIPEERPWAELRRAETRALTDQLTAGRYRVSGKSLNKDEFVTCGGVALDEVDLRRMQSRLAPGLFFAGEVLDIDGLTGGFNLQAAWTTGWIAAGAIAEHLG